MATSLRTKRLIFDLKRIILSMLNKASNFDHKYDISFSPTQNMSIVTQRLYTTYHRNPVYSLEYYYSRDLNSWINTSRPTFNWYQLISRSTIFLWKNAHLLKYLQVYLHESFCKEKICFGKSNKLYYSDISDRIYLSFITSTSFFNNVTKFNVQYYFLCDKG